MSNIHSKQLENLGKIKVVNIEDNEDGSSKITFDVKEEFVKAYNDLYGLAKWDQEHFEKTFINAIDEALIKECRKNEQNPDFLWSIAKEDNE